MQNQGIYYIATGDQFVAEAERSARSVRDAMPEVPIAIATDVEPEFDFEFDHVIEIEDPDYSFTDQIATHHASCAQTDRIPRWLPVN